MRTFLVNTQASFDPLVRMSELDVALRELTGERRRPVKMAHTLLWAALKQTIAAQFWYDDMLQLAWTDLYKENLTPRLPRGYYPEPTQSNRSPTIPSHDLLRRL